MKRWQKVVLGVSAVLFIVVMTTVLWPRGEGAPTKDNDAGEDVSPVDIGLMPGSEMQVGDGVHGVVDASIVGVEVTQPDICAEKGHLSETMRNTMGVRATWDVEADIVSCAKQILEGYQSQGDISLKQDGYIDLFGKVWGCTVWSEDGWVELAFVEDKSSDEGTLEGGDGMCTVSVARLGKDAVDAS